VLLYDLWKLLRGEELEEVRLDDVKVVIQGVLRINDHKRIGIDNTTGEEQTQIGFYNEKEQFCLAAEDVPKICVRFCFPNCVLM
jgi:hypothetical protein